MPKLNLTIYTARSPVPVGQNQNITVRTVDAFTNKAVPSTKLDFLIKYASGLPLKFEGYTDRSGTFSYLWNINDKSKSGTFTVSVKASKLGYQSISNGSAFNVIPVTAVDTQLGGTSKGKTYRLDVILFNICCLDLLPKFNLNIFDANGNKIISQQVKVNFDKTTDKIAQFKIKNKVGQRPGEIKACATQPTSSDEHSHCFSIKSSGKGIYISRFNYGYMASLKD